MTIHTFAFAALLPLVPVRADDASARARLIGVWQQQDESGKNMSITFDYGYGQPAVHPRAPLLGQALGPA